jgi:hypothetical protein
MLRRPWNHSRSLNNFMNAKKNNISLWILIFTLTFAVSLFAAEKNFMLETTIWFDTPAKNFTESLPLGNGRLGAMMFGGVDEERIVPALPDAWKNGKVSGLRARGGFEVDITWQDGKLISATIRSDTGEPCAVSYGSKTVDLKIKKGKFITLNENMDLN